MANPNSLPLYEKYWYKHNYKRVIDSLILILLLLLLGYRVMYVNNYSIPWFIALSCETWFTLSWIFTVSTQWSPAFIKTNPDRLLQSVQELPAVDIFVTTADDELEPPIITINTVLSLLALDYPSHKLACYVSDDGCSPLIFYALHKASKFAKQWVPFCKKYKVQIRAPFRYFCDDNECTTNDQEFRQEWLQMKDMYENLSRKIDVDPKSIPSLLEGEFAVFSNTNRTNHPAIIKVIWENKEMAEDGLPHLIYISREKRPNQPHHFKAGAMNVLTRVSGLITNAPFMLNVDCDMFVNNPNIVMHALCILLDSKGEKEVAFAQCPQQFYATLKDDPFGNQMAILYKYLGAGLAGLQGMFYGGTNCFHRRKVIYGLSPDDVEKGNNLSKVDLKQKFGASKELMKSVGHALKDRTYSASDIDVNKAVEEAIHVASYGYEYGTGWGKQVGWMYGTMTEDILTGLTIHKKGWRSELCTPEPIAFTGCAPIDGPTCMAQHKRWATGMLEIFFSKHCPIFAAVFGKLSFREFLAYMWIMNWGFGPVAQVCYACLLAYCIITNCYFLPKDWGIYIPTAIVGIYKVYTLYEYLASGLSIKAWWNNQRMSRITSMNAGFCGFITVLLKLLGISNTVFDITKKDLPPSRDDRHDKNAGRYTFNESIVFLPGTTILLLQLTAIFIKLFGSQPPLYEIASGLGTPLSIDEVTQNRHFGLFARVLIDVDLSEKLFETVVVEREGHALSIEVQYEKQPSYCAHCKILGHSLHNCMKLGSTNKNEGPVKALKKVSHVLQLDKNQVKNNLSGKKNDANILTKNSAVEIVNVENLQNANSIEMHELAENFESSSAHDISGKEGTSGDMIVSPVIIKENDPSTLVLHNAFELLEADIALPSGKARLPDMDIATSLKDGCIENIAHSEVPSEKRPIQFVASSSRNQLLKDVSGLQSCTMPAAVSPGQTLIRHNLVTIANEPTTSNINGHARSVVASSPLISKEGLNSHNAVPIVDGTDLDKTMPLVGIAIPVGESHHQVVLSPIKMVTPVTTYEELGPDKSKAHIIGGSKNVTAAAKKSVQILSKLWGDVVDSDHTTDGTIDLDTDSEKMNMNPVDLKFLEAQPDALHQPKSSRKSRKSSSSARGKGSDGITSSDHIQTRYKKGVIKSNPKYVS